MRADHDGEGGILALLALGTPHTGPGRPVMGGALLITVVVGAAMLLGDGSITPAISVISAVEGIELFSPRALPWVLPLSTAILGPLVCEYHAGGIVCDRTASRSARRTRSTPRLTLLLPPWNGRLLGARRRRTCRDGSRSALRRSLAFWSASDCHGLVWDGLPGLDALLFRRMRDAAGRSRPHWSSRSTPSLPASGACP
jgi:hypothetical protein